MGMNFVSVKGGEIQEEAYGISQDDDKPSTPDSEEEDRRKILQDSTYNEGSYRSTKGVHVQKHYHVQSDPIDGERDWRRMP
jgi:hypothetical protein